MPANFFLTAFPFLCSAPDAAVLGFWCVGFCCIPFFLGPFLLCDICPPPPWLFSLHSVVCTAYLPAYYCFLVFAWAAVFRSGQDCARRDLCRLRLPTGGFHPGKILLVPLCAAQTSALLVRDILPMLFLSGVFFISSLLPPCILFSNCHLPAH